MLQGCRKLSPTLRDNCTVDHRVRQAIEELQARPDRLNPVPGDDPEDLEFPMDWRKHCHAACLDGFEQAESFFQVWFDARIRQ